MWSSEPVSGRTGTNSLKLALEAVGFRPFVITCTRLRPILNSSSLANGAGQRADWETIFSGYKSQVDWPGARYWCELAYAFPEAKVILTVRPAEDWYRSFAATVGLELFSPPTSGDPVAVTRREMQHEIIARQVFHGRPLDRAHATAVFHNHLERVQRAIALERLWSSTSPKAGSRCATSWAWPLRIFPSPRRTA